MPYQRIKYYQAGSFAAANRLLDPDQRTVQAESGRSNAITCGHRACQGCGEALGARYALDAAQPPRSATTGSPAHSTSTPWLSGTADAPAIEPAPAEFERLNPWYYADAPRTIRPVLEAARRQSTFEEVVGGLDATCALFEARRCLPAVAALPATTATACVRTTR